MQTVPRPLLRELQTEAVKQRFEDRRTRIPMLTRLAGEVTARVVEVPPSDVGLDIQAALAELPADLRRSLLDSNLGELGQRYRMTVRIHDR